MSEVANELSKCSMKDVEKPQADRSYAIPMTRLPLQVPENVQARAAARPGKITGPAPRYNNYGAAAPPAPIDATEQRRTMRNATVHAQYAVPNPSYPRKHAACKAEDGEGIVGEGPNGLQRKQELYMARKVAAAQGGAGSLWY